MYSLCDSLSRHQKLDHYDLLGTLRPVKNEANFIQSQVNVEFTDDDASALVMFEDVSYGKKCCVALPAHPFIQLTILSLALATHI